MTGELRAGNVKGVTFVGVRAFVQTRGEHAWATVLDAMPPEDRLVANEALAVGWYPASVFESLLRAIERELPARHLPVMVEMGRFQAEHDLNVFFRVMLRFWSPAVLVEKTAQFWGRYNDTGTWTVERVGDRRVVGSLHGWVGASDLLCANIAAYIARLFELVGAKTARAGHTECVARGGKCCQWTIDWT